MTYAYASMRVCVAMVESGRPAWFLLARKHRRNYSSFPIFQQNPKSQEILDA
jgi:hypothetical protein